MEYRVKWEIDVEADSPEDAANIACSLHLAPESTASVYDVRPAFSHGPWVRVDLDKPDKN